MKTTAKNSKRWLALGLVLFILGAMLSGLMQNQFGSVAVKHVYFNNKDGYRMSGFLYVPKNATAETPAPAIVTGHGNNNYTSALAALNIELSRRGYVVLSVELEGHGASDEVPDAAGDGSYGGIAACEYLMQQDFVDDKKIGGTGHSKGANVAIGMAKAYPDNVNCILNLGYMSPSVTNGDFDKAAPHTNVGFIMSRYDEAGQDLLHHLYGTEWNYDYLNEPTLWSEMWGGEHVKDYVNVGLGDWSNGTKRIFYTQEKGTHTTTVNKTECVVTALNFFNSSMPAPNWIDASNQVWRLRQFSGIAQTIGFVITFLASGSLLLRAPFFSVLSAEKSAPTGTLTGKRGWGYRAFFIILLTVIPALTFAPVYVWGENNGKQTALFPFNPSSVGYLLWTLANAVIIFVIFVIWHLVYGKKHGGNLKVYGFSFESKKDFLPYIGKAVAYAVVIIVVMFALLKVTESTLLVEMTLPTAVIRTFSLGRLKYTIEYLVPFLVSYLLTSLAFGAILRDDDNLEDKSPSTKNMFINQIIGVLQGAGGLAIMFGIWLLIYIVTLKPGFYRESSPYVMGGSGFMSCCNQLIPMFAINSILGTHFNVKTRRVWVGAIIAALFIVWCTFAGQSLALPSTQSAVGSLAS